MRECFARRDSEAEEALQGGSREAVEVETG